MNMVAALKDGWMNEWMDGEIVILIDRYYFVN